MDLSKLPKLSDSSQAPQPAAPAPDPATSESRPVDYGGYRPAAPSGIGADIWFNVIVAIILLFLGRSFFSWSVAKMTGQTFHTNVNWTEGPNAGSEVAYFDLQGFTAWTDAGMFLFGLAVLFEAMVVSIAQLKPSGPARALVYFALLLTVLCTAINLFVSIKLMSTGILPLMSGLAVAFGGYMIVSIRGVLQTR
jgi:hypothetical protein